MSDTQHNLYNRIYAYGGPAEDKEKQFSMLGTTRGAPSGYTLNLDENYIQDDESVKMFGLFDRDLLWTEVATPDELFDAAMEELKQSTRRYEVSHE